MQSFSRRVASENYERAVLEKANQERLQTQMQQLTLLVDDLSKRFSSLATAVNSNQHSKINNDEEVYVDENTSTNRT